MINNIFLKQIEKYNPNNIEGIKNSMKEVLQDIILSGLGKSDFFKKAVFYGGTSLRIFRNLPRFSEDLDFTLIDKLDENVHRIGNAWKCRYKDASELVYVEFYE